MTTAETITVNDSVTLHAVNESHVSGLYQMVQRNKVWLQQTLNWPQYVNSEQDSRQNVQGNMMLHQRGIAKMFLIFVDNQMAGVLSFNLIEPSNKTGYIGYWLDEAHQGKGILSRSLQAFMRHYVELGTVRRFVIKCRVDNHSSNAVALRNGFMLEGCLREAEYLNGRYDDVNTYARLFPL